MVALFLILGLTLGTTTTGLIAYGHLTEPYVEQSAVWPIDPVVLVMPDAAVSLAEVEEAVAWWEDRGLQFGDVDALSSHVEPTLGAVIIDVPDGGDFGDGTRGLTIQHLYETEPVSVMLAAVVLVEEIEDAELRRLVLIHELGHAQGYNHARARLPRPINMYPHGHIMTPYANWLGEDVDGMYRIVPGEEPEAREQEGVLEPIPDDPITGSM